MNEKEEKEKSPEQGGFLLYEKIIFDKINLSARVLLMRCDYLFPYASMMTLKSPTLVGGLQNILNMHTISYGIVVNLQPPDFLAVFKF